MTIETAFPRGGTDGGAKKVADQQKELSPIIVSKTEKRKSDSKV